MQNDQRTVNYLEDNESLADFCAAEDLPGKIGFDTEFLRVKTYYPMACLFQVATTRSLALIDVLKIDDLSPFLEWLQHPEVMVIMHAAGQDLELLQHMTGRLPTNIFDTQIANAFLQEDGQLGYGGLVEQQFGISLEKSQSRTDWSKRPLSSAQQEYAVDDVRYLHQLQQALEADLQANAFHNWFKEDCEALERLSFTPSDNDLLHRVKAKRGLSRQQLATVRALAVWRESEAIKHNLPRKWLLADQVLVTLANTLPGNAKELTASEALSEKQQRRYGSAILALIEKTRSSTADSWPVVGDSHSPEARNLFKRLQKEVKAVATRLGITPGLLASRKTLQALINDEQDCALLSGWRHEQLGKTLLTLME